MQHWLLLALVCLPYASDALIAEEGTQASNASEVIPSTKAPPTRIDYGYNTEVRKELKLQEKALEKERKDDEQAATPQTTPAVVTPSTKMPPTRITHGYNAEVRQEIKRQVEVPHHHHHYCSAKPTRYEVTPHLHKACHVFLTSELLYWTTKVEGLDYGMSYYSNNFFGKMRNINPQFRIGYRNAIKHEIDNSRWDLNLIWTCYLNSADNHTQLNPNQFFAVTKLNKNLEPFGNQGAKAHWHIDFNALDLEAGYNLGWNSRFGIRPFAGAKFAKIEQRLRVKYLDVTGSGTFVAGNYFSRDHYTSLNYGLRVGMRSQYYVGGGFKIFLNTAVALMWGTFDLMHNENLEQHLKIPRYRSVYHNHVQSVNPEFEIAAGIGWQIFFRERHYYLDLRLGWEQQVWFAQNQVYRQEASFGSPAILKTNEADLAFAGPSFAATFGF